MAHLAPDRFAPRALLVRDTVSLEVTAFEAHLLIKQLQTRAELAADDPDMIDFADFLFRRVAELREATR